MKKKESLDKPRIKGLRILCIGIAAIWLVATFGVYKESKREKFDLSVKPGAVTYGTHSAPLIPMVSISSRRTTLPVVSGDEVRSSALYGHAATPSTTTGSSYRVYTTSSASARTSGGGVTGGGRSSSSSSSSSQYGGGHAVLSMLLPSFAPSAGSISNTAVTPTNMATTSMRMNIGPRRVNPRAGETGQPGDPPVQDTEDSDLWWWWDEDAEDWVSGDPPVGTVKEEGGVMYEWNGTSWIIKGQVSDLGTPVGDAPWLLLILLMTIYVTLRICKKRHIAIK